MPDSSKAIDDLLRDIDREIGDTNTRRIEPLIRAFCQRYDKVRAQIAALLDELEEIEPPRSGDEK